VRRAYPRANLCMLPPTHTSWNHKLPIVLSGWQSGNLHDDRHRRSDAQQAAVPDGGMYGCSLGRGGRGRQARLLIRDVPDDVVAAVDARASRLGLSRSEYVRRRLAQDAATTGTPVSVQDLARFTEVFGDLQDSEVMSQAWR